MKLAGIIKALNELAPLKVLRRDDGSYYCNLGSVEIGSRGFLVSPTCAAQTPRGAILECWADHTTRLKPSEFVVVNAYQKERRELVWADGKWTPRQPTRDGLLVRNVKDLARSHN